MRFQWLVPAATAIALFAWLLARDVRVAVLPGDGEASANLAALLENKLAQRSGVAVVERAAVATILREQKLQALFSPDAVSRRTVLGKLLKADLLVLLRKASPPEKGLEMIGCDTSQGLRLCVERIPSTGDASADANQLQAIVAQALKKRGESISQIVAVPPFVSNDLGLAAQALQRPLAKIIEQALLQRPGVVVVETSEAKALATEMALSSSTGIERKMPLYLLGDYRHDAPSGDSPLKFQLRMIRGEKVIGTRTSSLVKLSEAAVALPRRALELLDEITGSDTAPFSAGDEAAQLARRADTMYRVESWPEAIDLAEASLLLKPGQAPMHRLLADALQLEAQRREEAPIDPAETPAEREQRLQALYLQGLPHLEAFMSASQFVMKRDYVVASPYLRHCSDRAALRAMMLRILAAKQAAGSGDETVRCCLECAVTSLAELSPDEIDRWKLAAAQAWPEAADRDGQILARFMALNADLSDHRKVDWIARSLRDLETPAASAAAQALKVMAAQFAAMSQHEEKSAAVSSEDDLPGVAAVVRRVPLPMEISGAVSAGPKLDFAWGNNVLYSWPDRKDALPQPMLHVAAGRRGTPGCYDGRFAWVYCTPGEIAQGSITSPGSAGLAAIDPITKRVTLLDAKSGLPSDEVRTVSLAPLAPGKVCAVGHFGPSAGGRVWIAIATLDTSSGGTIRIIHEARDFNAGAAADWRNSHVAFDVSRAHTLHVAQPGGAARTAVIVERGAMDHPLLIDPESLRVSVVEEPVCGEFPSQLVPHDGALYWLGASDGGYRVCRYALPGLKIERGRELFAQSGNLFFHKNRSGILRDGKLLLADDPMGHFHSVPLRSEGKAEAFGALHMLASDKHGLLFARFGNLYELALP